MSLEAPTPLPTRASSEEREHAIRRLADQLAEERLSQEGFADRLEGALGARNRQQLDELFADLPAERRLSRPLRRAVARLSRFAAAIRGAWDEPLIPRLALPAEARRLVLGRGRGCDLVLAHPSVSRRHAELVREGRAWVLRDLRSTNGTRVNGLRIAEAVEVAPGDRVSFGEMRYRLTTVAGDESA